MEPQLQKLAREPPAAGGFPRSPYPLCQLCGQPCGSLLLPVCERRGSDEAVWTGIREQVKDRYPRCPVAWGPLVLQCSSPPALPNKFPTTDRTGWEQGCSWEVLSKCIAFLHGHRTRKFRGGKPPAQVTWESHTGSSPATGGENVPWGQSEPLSSAYAVLGEGDSSLVLSPTSLLHRLQPLWLLSYTGPLHMLSSLSEPLSPCIL